MFLTQFRTERFSVRYLKHSASTLPMSSRSEILSPDHAWTNKKVTMHKQKGLKENPD